MREMTMSAKILVPAAQIRGEAVSPLHLVPES